MQESNFFRSFDFTADFDTEMRRAETRTKIIEQKKTMRSFEDSAKSKKTVASMIEKKDGKEVSKPGAMQQGKSKPASEPDPEPAGGDGEELSHEQMMANRKAMMMGKMKNKGTKSCFIVSSANVIVVESDLHVGGKAKSPKTEKKGKEKTTWDPFMFGGKGATGQEAKNLDRSAAQSNGNGESEAGELPDHQMSQFVPDASVIGRSASKTSGMNFILRVVIQRLIFSRSNPRDRGGVER